MNNQYPLPGRGYPRASDAISPNMSAPYMNGNQGNYYHPQMMTNAPGTSMTAQYSMGQMPDNISYNNYPMAQPGMSGMHMYAPPHHPQVLQRPPMYSEQMMQRGYNPTMMGPRGHVMQQMMHPAHSFQMQSNHDAIFPEIDLSTVQPMTAPQTRGTSNVKMAPSSQPTPSPVQANQHPANRPLPPVELPPRVEPVPEYRRPYEQPTMQQQPEQPAANQQVTELEISFL